MVLGDDTNDEPCTVGLVVVFTTTNRRPSWVIRIPNPSVMNGSRRAKIQPVSWTGWRGRIHVSTDIVVEIVFKDAVFGTSMNAPVPSKPNASPTLPGTKATPDWSTPFIEPAISFALPLPGHQAMRPT